jgi:hypothetical protein
MMRRITILFLPIILALFLTISAFALTKEERAWKEDILTLLSLVKRVGDYSEVVDLIEVAPALKEDPEIKKAYVASAPLGVRPPIWAREEVAPPTIIEVPEKSVPAEITEKVSPEGQAYGTGRRESEQVSREEKEERARAEEARRIAREVTAQKEIREREIAPPAIIREEPKIEVPKEAEIVTEGPPEKIGMVEEVPVKEELPVKIGEELGVIPTPLPPGTKVIHSTDVVSGVKAEMVKGKMRVTITLSGERKYTVSERTRPPSIIIDIPHTINAVFPKRIMVDRGCVRKIEVTQYRSIPFDEARITLILNRGTEYQITHRENEIYIDFEE